MKIDPSIYLARAFFWGAFGFTRMILARSMQPVGKAAEADPVAGREQVAPFSRVLVGFHMAGFAGMFWGIGAAVFSGHQPRWFPLQRVTGGVVIGVGALL